MSTLLTMGSSSEGGHKEAREDREDAPRCGGIASAPVRHCTDCRLMLRASRPAGVLASLLPGAGAMDGKQNIEQARSICSRVRRSTGLVKTAAAFAHNSSRRSSFGAVAK